MTIKATPGQSREASDRWENEGGQPAQVGRSAATLRAELERLGVKSVAVTIYEWGGYRYTHAADAIAAAKRAA